MSSSISLNYLYPCSLPPKSNLLRTREREGELMYVASSLIGSNNLLTEVNINFANGSVILHVQPADNPEYSGTYLVDVMATKFFQQQKEHIESINPSLISRLENLSDRKGIEKITDIFYFAFNNYLEENKGDEIAIDSTIAETRLGFKNPKYLSREVMDMEGLLGYDSGLKFMEFVKSLPTSLLDKKGYKKAAPFLAKSLEQKASLQDKLLYLRQVIGFLLLQDVFKNILESAKLEIAINKQRMYSAPDRDSDLTLENQNYAYKSNRVDETLSKFPMNSVLTLIPLACRSHPSKLSDFDLLDTSSDEHPSVIDSKYLAQECNNARQADIALREVLEDSFNSSPQKFLVENEIFDMYRVESFLMGVSGLAISPGLYGRLPMYDHHHVYFKRSERTSISPVSDNFPYEFLMTAAQFLFEKEYNWIEENSLAYLQQMMGNPSIYELDTIKAKFRGVKNVVEKIPVETLLKPRSTSSGQYILRNSGMKKLHALYQQGREMSGLQPTPSREDSSSCTIS